MSGGQPQMMLTSDGEVWCNYSGPVGDRVGALSERGDVARLGNWLMGSPEDDPNVLMLSKVGTGEVIALFHANGNAYLKEKASSVLKDAEDCS